MENLIRNVEVSVSATPKEVADLFWSMSEHEQALFFNALYVNVMASEQKEYAFAMQMQYLTDSHELTDGGRKIMAQIGNYSSNQ